MATAESGVGFEGVRVGLVREEVGVDGGGWSDLVGVVGREDFVGERAEGLVAEDDLVGVVG